MKVVAPSLDLLIILIPILIIDADKRWRHRANS